MEYQILIDNKDYTQYVSLPLSEQLALDRSLDFGSLKLNYTDIAEPIKPFTDVVIKLIWEDKTKELYYFVSNDNCQEIIQTGRYTHTLLLIEQTKWLERFIGRTHPITQPLIKTINQGEVYATLNKSKSFESSASSRIKIGNLVSPIVVNKYLFMSPYEFSNTYIEPTTDLIITNTALKIYKNGRIKHSYTGNSAVNVKLEEGQYKFVYTSYAQAFTLLEASYTFYITVIKSISSMPSKTITSEVNNVLATIETLWTNETPRFTFNEEQAEKYKDVVIPELTLTGTLFEQLSQIGNCIHAVPRLRNGVIYFDEWGSEEITIAQNYWNTKLGDYISNVQSFDIEQYAIAIDSNVDNFVTGNEDILESVIEPHEMGYKTIRAESNVVQITDTNAIISTKYPIEKIVSLKVGFANENNWLNLEIADFVYSSTEYEALSSISDGYPTSKAFALKYDVGQKNITGLSFKLPDVINPIFQDYAIENIINKKLEIQGESTVNVGSIQQLQFQVTYIPIINGRAKQYKANIKEISKIGTLAYNQSSQKISSTAIGEAMKGAVEKLGNPELTKTYLIPQDLSGYITSIKTGQKFDDNYYISIIKREYYPEFIKMELGLSKNFNKLNEYVGVDSEIRFYEISENQVVNTQILYEEFCVIGDDLESYDENVAISLKDIALRLQNNFVRKINLVSATGHNGTDKYEKIILPLATYSLGNSILVTFGYDDNYSAGLRVERESGGVFQYQVPYTDTYGEIKELEIVYGRVGEEVDITYEKTIMEGDALPTEEGIDYSGFYGDMSMDIVINKESRAIPTINYMLHFVTNRDDIVIGEGMAKYSHLCYDNETSWIYERVSVYVFDKKIGKYDTILNGGTEIGTLSCTVSPKNYIEFSSLQSTVEGKSWAVVKEIDGVKHLLFGQNKNITANSVINLPKLNFTHIIK